MKTTITRPTAVIVVTCDWCGAFICEVGLGFTMPRFVGDFSLGPFEFHKAACYEAAVAAIKLVLEEARKGARA